MGTARWGGYDGRNLGLDSSRKLMMNFNVCDKFINFHNKNSKIFSVSKEVTVRPLLTLKTGILINQFLVFFYGN